MGPWGNVRQHAPCATPERALTRTFINASLLDGVPTRTDARSAHAPRPIGAPSARRGHDRRCRGAASAEMRPRRAWRGPNPHHPTRTQRHRRVPRQGRQSMRGRQRCTDFSSTRSCARRRVPCNSMARCCRWPPRRLRDRTANALLTDPVPLGSHRLPLPAVGSLQGVALHEEAGQSCVASGRSDIWPTSRWPLRAGRGRYVPARGFPKTTIWLPNLARLLEPRTVDSP